MAGDHGSAVAMAVAGQVAMAVASDSGRWRAAERQHSARSDAAAANGQRAALADDAHERWDTHPGPAGASAQKSASLTDAPAVPAGVLFVCAALRVGDARCDEQGRVCS